MQRKLLFLGKGIGFLILYCLQFLKIGFSFVEIGHVFQKIMVENSDCFDHDKRAYCIVVEIEKFGFGVICCVLLVKNFPVSFLLLN